MMGNVPEHIVEFPRPKTALDSRRKEREAEDAEKLKAAIAKSGKNTAPDSAISTPCDTEEGQSNDIVEDIEPWQSRVDGADLLNEIENAFTRHVILPSGASTALALWVMGTYCMDAWRIWPKLLITSPEKRCGKSTLLETLEGTCFRALLVSNITPSALFRSIEEWQPTILIDEADTFVKDNVELNGIINSGHTKRTAHVIRSESVGNSYEPRKFSTWAPMVLAGIKTQRDTLHDRSIHIQMRRKHKGESVERMPLNYFENGKTLRRKCLCWTLENLGKLKSATPDVPNNGNDRAQNNWTPLFSIADLAGGQWPEKVKSAYGVLTGSDDDTDGDGLILLQDIRTIFDTHGRNQLFSDDLVSALTALDERPWCEWNHGKTLTQRGLAGLLKPFGVKPCDIRIGDIVRRGYKCGSLEDAWKRYL